jgi:hypothetical protein
MIKEKFGKLITFIESCNGTGHQELIKRINAGEITEEDAVLVELYAKLNELDTRLSFVSSRIDAAIQ